MTESRLEKLILYILVFILFTALFVLIVSLVVVESFNLKNNKLDVLGFLVSLFGMIATAGAAFAALVSTNISRESLKQQNKNNQRELMPLIVIEEKEFNLEFDESNVKKFDLNWDTSLHGLSDNKAKGDYSTLDIVNISNGVAKNIVVKLLMEDYDLMISQLENRPIKNLSITKIKKQNKIDTDALYIGTNRDIKGYGFDMTYQLNNFNQESFLFIQQNGGKKKIKMPSAFLVLVNLFANENLRASAMNLPTLTYIISYEDIVGREYEVKYKVKVGLVNISFPSKENRAVKLSLSAKPI